MSRWDLGAIEELPSYMRIMFRIVLETVEEIDKEMMARGKSDTMQPTIDESKSLVISYLAISKWARAGHVPSFDEYMEVGLVTAGMDDLAAYGYIAMDDCDEKQLKEWFYSKPKIFQALSAYFRLINDIVSFEVEMSRGEVANGVNCYMQQHGVTQKEAVEKMSKMAQESYKIMMDEFMMSATTMPRRQIVVRVINIARVIAVYYREGDGFKYPHGKLKDRLTALFLQPIPL
ncbi:unnamed protein product [Microthlaspi erraticum]|uniref:Terpene synthase metal-binding domain-containing protein n=1 Tax=Microthlaspi erraticum TaxID=1685480 RepID=A0A6D2HLH8_9BRAS|nr:unnamed protein product [Microthlaspi erraticum]CAA7029931.1 unnamed protein product [Microthlaspi erraticum]